MGLTIHNNNKKPSVHMTLGLNVKFLVVLSQLKIFDIPKVDGTLKKWSQHLLD